MNRKPTTVVFLDAGTLPAGLQLATADGFDYRAYPFTTLQDVASRIRNADVITSKVKLSTAALDQAVNLRLVCVAAAGTDNVGGGRIGESVARLARGLDMHARFTQTPGKEIAENELPLDELLALD